MEIRGITERGDVALKRHSVFLISPMKKLEIILESAFPVNNQTHHSSHHKERWKRLFFNSMNFTKYLSYSPLYNHSKILWIKRITDWFAPIMLNKTQLDILMKKFLNLEKSSTFDEIMETERETPQCEEDKWFEYEVDGESFILQMKTGICNVQVLCYHKSLRN